MHYIASHAHTIYAQELDIASVFNVVLDVPALHEPEIKSVFTSLDVFGADEVDMAMVALMDASVPIKRLLTLVDLAQQSSGKARIPGHVWAQVLADLRA